MVLYSRATLQQQQWYQQLDLVGPTFYTIGSRDDEKETGFRQLSGRYADEKRISATRSGRGGGIENRKQIDQ